MPRNSSCESEMENAKTRMTKEIQLTKFPVARSIVPKRTGCPRASASPLWTVERVVQRQLGRYRRLVSKADRMSARLLGIRHSAIHHSHPLCLCSRKAVFK